MEKFDRLSIAKHGVAALAAGAGLATGTPSEAVVIYTNVGSVPITNGLTLDLNNDLTPDFSFTVYGEASPTFVAGTTINNKVHGFFTYFYGGHSDYGGYGGSMRQDASALPPGFLVGPGGSFFAHGHMLKPDGPDAPWDLLASGEKRYLGFWFAVGGNTHFGWAGVTKGSLTLNDYAYESDPNRAIPTGAPVPEPSTLLLMALGAPAVLAFRRWRAGR